MPLAIFRKVVIMRALERLLINPPIKGTTKKASFEYLYWLQTVVIVAIDTGTAPNPKPECPVAITAAS